MAGFTRILFRETMRDKSLLRTLTNVEAARVPLAGSGLDLGAKDGRSSYWRFFPKDEKTSVTFSDVSPQSDDVLRVDLMDRIPVPDDSQDFLILMHVLEHLPRHEPCLTECHRVLRPGGLLVGSVPFLHRIHPDPDDAFRYTGSTLRRILQEAGFDEVDVRPLGFGPLTAGTSQFIRLFRFRLLKFLVYGAAIGGDRLLNRVLPGSPNVRWDNYPLAYFFVATKRGAGG